MSRNLYTITTLFSFLVGLSSCADNSTENKVNEESTIKNDSTIEVIDEEQTHDEVETIWSVYEGNVGLYGQQIVMELLLKGTKVTGSYFYAKHQKSLTLSGEMDPITNEIFLSESYKGKTTGYMEFTLVKGELNGYWKKSLSAKENEPFHADLVNLGELTQKEYMPSHEKYENEHEITFYDAEEDYTEQVKNVLMINKIGNDHISFYYSVVCTNGHSGSLEGMAKMINSKTALYSDGGECEVLFHFKKDGKKDYIDVEETGNCDSYHGFRAYFDWEMYRVK